MLKNKSRIIQVILIFSILVTSIFVYTGAASSYELKSSGTYVTSSGKEDILDVAGFEDNDVLAIRYSLYKGNLPVNEKYNLEVKLLSSGGDILNWADYPYLSYIHDGYFDSDITLLYDYNKFVEYSRETGNIELLNNFKLRFVIVNYVNESVPDGNGGETIVSSPVEETFETRVVKLFENGRLCKSSIDADMAHLGKLDMTPIDVNGFTSTSEIKFNSYDEQTSTYDADLEISLGERESLKNFVYDISLMSDLFPYRDILVNSSNSISVAMNDNNVDNAINVVVGNTLTNPIDGTTTTKIGEKKYLIIKATRPDNSSKSETYNYYVTFKTFSGDIIKVNLNIKANFTQFNSSFEESKTSMRDSAVRKISLDGNYGMFLNFKYVPYKIEILNESGNVAYSENQSFEDYVTKRNDGSYDIKVSLGDNVASGFYTIKAYQYLGSLSVDDNGLFVVPTNDKLILSTMDTFYISKATPNIGLIANGKNYKVENNEVTIDAYMNSNLGSTKVKTYGKFGFCNKVFASGDITFEAVDNLASKKAIQGITYDYGKNILTIPSDIEVSSFYILAYPNENRGYTAFKVNLNKISYQEYVVGYSNTDDITVSIPVTEEDPMVSITPTLLVNGKNANIKDYKYDYKVLDEKGNVSTNPNVFVTKTKNGDAVHYNDFSFGTYTIRCYLVDSPNDYVDKTIIVRKKDESELHTYNINFENMPAEVAVPKDAGKINKIKINSTVSRDKTPTSIIPEYRVVGDSHVTVSGEYLIVKKGAKIDNTVLLIAELKDSSKQNILADMSVEIKLVEQNNNNNSTIVDDTEGGNGGGSSDVTYQVPSSIDVFYKGNVIEDTLDITLESSSSDKITLDYIAYDESGRYIKNPAISMDVTLDDNSGTSIVKDYSGNQIVIACNSVYTSRHCVVSFYANETLLNSVNINITPSKNFDTRLYFVQKNFDRGGKVEARATFTNNSPIDAKVILAIACYDKNDKMLSLEKTDSITVKANSKYELTIGDNEKIDYMSAKLTLPYDLEDIKVKAFLLEGDSIDAANGYFANSITLTNREIN